MFPIARVSNLCGPSRPSPNQEVGLQGDMFGMRPRGVADTCAAYFLYTVVDSFEHVACAPCTIHQSMPQDSTKSEYTGPGGRYGFTNFVVGPAPPHKQALLAFVEQRDKNNCADWGLKRPIWVKIGPAHVARRDHMGRRTEHLRDSLNNVRTILRGCVIE